MSRLISILPATLLSVGLTLASLSLKAEDIEIFVGSSGGSAAAPQVMILLDSTNDWSSDLPNGTAKITALKTALDTITSANPVSVGLAMWSYNSPSGAYVRFAPRDMSVPA